MVNYHKVSNGMSRNCYSAEAEFLKLQPTVDRLVIDGFINLIIHKAYTTTLQQIDGEDDCNGCSKKLRNL